jgi:hypothetical protein
VDRSERKESPAVASLLAVPGNRESLAWHYQDFDHSAHAQHD